MAGSYGNIGRAAYSRSDIMHEMQRSQYQYARPRTAPPADFGHGVGYGGCGGYGRCSEYSGGGGYGDGPATWAKPNQSPTMESFPYRQASTAAPGSSAGPSSWQHQHQQSGDPYAGYEPSAFEGIPQELLEGACNFETREGKVVSERMVETRQEFTASIPYSMLISGDAKDQEAVRHIMQRTAEIEQKAQIERMERIERERITRMSRMTQGAGGQCGVQGFSGGEVDAGGDIGGGGTFSGSVAITGVKPIYMMEKVVEVPHVITKEYERHVPKPEIIERLVHVPKTEIKERTVKLPNTVQYKEQIVEVPEVVVEEQVIHIPKREIQERLIEVPKVRYVERIEYEDIIEYREVHVDKIVEVPEIEYRVREVEHFVPQRYVQEYFVDKYKEYPVTQIQEVERIEHIPLIGPPAGGASGPAGGMSMGFGTAPGAGGGGFYQQQAAPQPSFPVRASPAGSASSTLGSHFLVPKGTLPRGHLDPEQAKAALLAAGSAMSPGGGGSVPTSIRSGEAAYGRNIYDSVANGGGVVPAAGGAHGLYPTYAGVSLRA